MALPSGIRSAAFRPAGPVGRRSEWYRVDLVKTEPELKIAVGAATDVGGRSDNEDTVLVTELPAGDGPDAGPAGVLMAVADGMGGHQRGEVASQLAMETVQSVLLDAPTSDTALLLKQAFRRANERIYQDGSRNGDANMMGTTLVAAVIRGKYATIANVGDSRAYLVRANRLTQITQDHSLVAEQVSQGTITPTEARDSPHRNILTHALGHREKLDPKMPNIFELVMLAEDRLLLCSDGFYDVVADEDFVSILLENEPESAVRRLVDVAKSRRTTDNVSAVVARFMPARVAPERELVAAGRGDGFGSFLIPVIVIGGVIVFIAIVLLVLTFL
jgi:protein phosphatase